MEILRVPFWAIKLFPRAGRPTMMTAIRVSSTLTPVELVYTSFTVAIFPKLQIVNLLTRPIQGKRNGQERDRQRTGGDNLEAWCEVTISSNSVLG